MSVKETSLAVALAAALVGSMVGAGAVAIGAGVGAPTAPGPAPDGTATPTDDPTETPGSGPDDRAELVQFSSEDDFTEYLQSSDRSRTYLGRPTVVRATDDVERETTADAAGNAGDAAGGNGGGPDRVSGTNVQEQGIDEPDVLKTDGRTAYYSPISHRHEYGGDVKAVDVRQPADPELVGEVPASGRMLLTNDTLVVFERQRLVAYDVTDPAEPEHRWTRDLNGSVTSARLLDGRLYLVVRDRPEAPGPCPVRPMEDVSVPCDEVYHPSRPIDADATYTATTVDPADGTVLDTETVVGGTGSTVTYVSENAIYLSYTNRTPQPVLFLRYLGEEADLDAQARERLDRLKTLDISMQAKATEARVIVQDWLARQPVEDRRELQRDLHEGFQEYQSERGREIHTTGIVKIAIDGPELSAAAVGEVPGRPLNQFSMDERDGRLRIATTVPGPLGDSENDLYVLDESLDRVGEVQGMSPELRIYSVRFIEDRAYLVTFRQVDPFHVVDLSDPTNPDHLGKVRLPGFSRYLHPIGEDRILGVGEENSKTKLVIFDASDPTDPEVADSLQLDERWSAVARTHHAFLHDPRHEAVFVPGSDGAHVISYGDGLELERTVAVEGRSARAMYLNDYLYVFGPDRLVVLNETDWSTETTLSYRR